MNLIVRTLPRPAQQIWTFKKYIGVVWGIHQAKFVRYTVTGAFSDTLIEVSTVHTFYNTYSQRFAVIVECIHTRHTCILSYPLAKPKCTQMTTLSAKSRSYSKLPAQFQSLFYKLHFFILFSLFTCRMIITTLTQKTSGVTNPAVKMKMINLTLRIQPQTNWMWMSQR